MIDIKLQSAKALTLVNISVMISREQNGTRLTVMEHKIVQYLDGHNGRAVFDWELRDYLYRGICSEPLVRVHIRNIRRKLGPAFIETADEGGYRLASQRAALLQRVCARCMKPVVEYEGGEFVCYGCTGTASVDLQVGRADGPGESSGKQWTADEETWLRAHSNDMSLDELGEILQRSGSSVRARLDYLGIEKHYVRRKR